MNALRGAPDKCNDGDIKSLLSAFFSVYLGRFNVDGSGGRHLLSDLLPKTTKAKYQKELNKT